MKKAFLAFLACALAVVSHAQELAATIKQEAEKCAKALVAGDFAQAATYSHPRIVAAMGGKEALIAQIANGMRQIRAEGFELIETRMGTPTPPKKIAAWLTSIVPQEIVMKAPDGRIVQESALLGLSEDEGKTWTFLDLGGMTPAVITRFFPELSGQITIPEKKKPVLQKETKR
jgi:hypothetical protein